MNVRSIQILEDAAKDLEDGRQFYEKQEASIGNYFWDCLITDIESLVIYAGVHIKEYGYYRMLAKRFPYAIYYEIKERVAYIVAVLPMRANPNWTEEKMDTRS